MNSKKEFDRKLIGLIENYPILYDLSKRTKAHVQTKEIIWKHIASAMNWDLSECQTRWRTIRDTYIKMHRMKDIGTAPIKSKYFLSSMRFLKTLLKDRQSLKKMKEMPQSLTSSNDSIENDVNVDTISTNDEDVDEKSTNDEDVDVTSINDKFPKTTNCGEVLKKDLLQTHTETPSRINQNERPINKRWNVSETSTDICNGHAKRLKFVPRSPSKAAMQTVPRIPNDKSLQIVPKSPDETFETENPVYTFFRSMAQIVAQFPPSYIAETRVRVCQCIGEMELKALSEKNE